MPSASLFRLLASVNALVLLASVASAQDGPRGPAARGVSASAAPDLWLATPEGFRLFDVRAVTATEALGSPGSYMVDAVLADPDVSAASLLGVPVTIGVRASPSRFRHVSGVVRHAQVSLRPGPDGDPLRYLSVEVGSPLYLLAASNHDRVFEGVTLAELVRAVLAGYPGLPLRVAARLPAGRRDYVQSDESDLEFLRRHLDPEGCALLVESREEGATVVLSDGRGRRRVVRRFEPDGSSFFSAHRRLSPHHNVVRASPTRGASASVLSGTAADPGRAVPSLRIALPASVSEEGARRVLASLADRSALATATVEGEPAAGPGDVLRVEGLEDASLLGDYRVLSSSWSVRGADRRATLTLMPLRPHLPARAPQGSRQLGVERVRVLAGDDGSARVDARGRVRVRFLWGPQPDGTHPELWVPTVGPAPPGGSDGLVVFEDGRASAPILLGTVAASPRR